MIDVSTHSAPATEHGDAYGIVIADDDDLLRGALAELIESHPRLHLLGQTDDGLAAAELCAEHRAQLAVVDVRMPHGGTEAIEAIKRANPDTVVACYTSHRDRRTRQRLLDAGAAAVFVKGGGDDLADAFAALLD